MFKNDELHRAINRENKYARQFIISVVLILMVNANMLVFLEVDKLSKVYWIHLAIIPVLLLLLVIFFFRQHRKLKKHILEEYNAKILAEGKKEQQAGE